MKLVFFSFSFFFKECHELGRPDSLLIEPENYALIQLNGITKYIRRTEAKTFFFNIQKLLWTIKKF